MAKLRYSMLLLDAGADVNIKNITGETPIFFTGLYNMTNAQKDVIGQTLQTLLEAGANPMIQNNEGNTPLHFASSISTNPNDILTLIANGANLMAKNGNGDTPLHLAATRSFENLRTLLETGADVMARNNLDITPIDAAICKRRYKSVRFLLKSINGIKLKSNISKRALKVVVENITGNRQC